MSNGIAILGTGDFAREMYWHVRDAVPGAAPVFVDDVTDKTSIDIGGKAVPVIKDWRFDAVGADDPDAPPQRVETFVIGVGSPAAKRGLVAKAIEAGLQPAPTVVHPRALVQDPKCRIGVGGVITPGCILTTNIAIGDYVLLNLNCTVGHDTVIGDYATCNPGCQISGNVYVGEGASLGTGTAVRQGIRLAAGIVTGAQACVVKNFDEPGVTIAGVPAKPLG
ncbi:MAG: hypothetical protein GWP08_03750 [Nitrospiraceae bacterium]|nr:hypothetical protein [Nitrospiraceae bacterium]